MTVTRESLIHCARVHGTDRMTTKSLTPETSDLAAVLRDLADTLKRPAVPVQMQWWDATDVAAYIGVRPRTVTEVYMLRPGFPKAARLPSTSGLGPLRWPAKEI